MSSRSRSKSPARKTRGNVAAGVVSPVAAPPKSPAAAAAPASADLDPNVATGIAVAVLVGAWSQCQGGELSLGGFATRLGDGFNVAVPEVPVPVVGGLVDAVFGKTFNLVATLHVLNSITSNRGGKGGWLHNFATCLLATFAGVIVPAILAGGNPLTTIFADQPSFTVTRFFVLWYILNYDIPGCPVNFGLWQKVSDLAGEPLQILLNFGSAVFNANLVITAAGAAGAHAVLSTGWFNAVVAAVVTGSAANFFPFNKAFTIPSGNDDFAKAFFIASNGFAFVDFFIKTVLGLVAALTTVEIAYTQDFGAQANDLICGPFGGVAAFVGTVATLNLLFGAMIPIETGKGFDMFGVVGKIMDAAQLA
jgi:hypothetical protein